MFVLVLIFIVIFTIAKMVTGGFYAHDVNTEAMDAKVAERVKPVAEVTVGMAAAAAKKVSAEPAVVDGKSVFQGTCFACHGTGAAGAPKIGDKANWGPRIAKGMDTLKKHAIHGFQGKSGVMPAKGGRPDLSDKAVIAAMEYMVGQSK
jgi:cytochrome c5